MEGGGDDAGQSRLHGTAADDLVEHDSEGDRGDSTHRVLSR